MMNLLRSDLYRIGKSKLMYIIMAITGIIAVLLSVMLHRDMRVGISVFGSLTAFKGIDDIIRIGITYQKGLGILTAFLVSILIGQEYLWKTWQHKWIIGKTRIGIYLSKSIFSSAISAAVFFVFELTVLLGSGQFSNILTRKYTAMILCGFAIYSALGAVVCLFSMLIKSNTTAIIICLCYILFSETVWSVVTKLSNVSSIAAGIVEFALRHSIYGMSMVVSLTALSADMTISVVMNSAVIILIASAVGVCVFQKYEL